MTDLERIDIAIDTVIQQIEMISSRSILETNRNNLDEGYLVELSSIFLQLVRSLNELLITKRLYEQGAPNSAIDALINGRSK